MGTWALREGPLAQTLYPRAPAAIRGSATPRSRRRQAWQRGFHRLLQGSKRVLKKVYCRGLNNQDRIMIGLGRTITARAYACMLLLTESSQTLYSSL